MSVGVNDVKAVIETQDGLDVTPFLNAAKLLVTEELAGVGLSMARLDLITTYLAAHFCSITVEQGGLISARVGQVQENYVPISSYREPLKGLAMTRYGQQAMILDTTGTLADLEANRGLKARFSLVGQKDDKDWTGDQSAV